GVAAACVAGGQAGVLLAFGAAPTGGPARVGAGAGGAEREWGEDGASQGGADQTERMAARNGLLCQRLRQLINAMGHGGYLSSQGRCCQFRQTANANNRKLAASPRGSSWFSTS